MNFNNLAQSVNNNILNESVVATEEMEGRRGRAPNPEIDKLVKQGMPYWKARAMVRKGMGGASAVSAAPAGDNEPQDVDEPAGTSSYKGDAKTQVAIDDFVAGNPEATVDDVIAHLKGLNAGPVGIRVGYTVDPESVARMFAIAKGDAGTEEPSEPTDLGKGADDEDVDRLTDLFMKLYSMPKDKRADYMRKLKAAEAEKEVAPDEDEEEDEDEVDPYVSQYVKGMKGKEEDEEEFNEPKED